MLDEISKQLREALNLQDYDSNAPGQTEEQPASFEIGCAPAMAKLEHRLSEKLNPDSNDALDFDWPTDADLMEVMQTHAAEGKDLGSLQIIGVNNNKF